MNHMEFYKSKDKVAKWLKVRNRGETTASTILKNYLV